MIMLLRKSVLTALSVLLMAALPGFASGNEAAVAESIRTLLDRSDEADTRATALVRKFYGSRNYRPAWGSEINRAALMEAIERVTDHGLLPGDFHTQRLASLSGATQQDVMRLAERDLLMTDAAIELIRQLRFGKAKPSSLDPDWNVTTDRGDPVPLDTLAAALDTGRVGELLDGAENRHPYYLALKAGLKHYREIASSGGWSTLVEGPLIRPGMVDERVRALRSRLRQSGDYTDVEPGDARFYDAGLEAAVRRFQDRHGLDADGIVGRATIDALNVPVRARIDQVRVNLERARWVLGTLERDFVLVNIAGFYMSVVHDGREVWRDRVIVGEQYHKTPVFRGTMTHVVFNPEWTVPSSIVTDEIAPEMLRDPGHLEENDFELRNREGEIIDPARVDWRAVADSGPGFDVVQRAGPGNALGRVKFMFPNRHAVYLHDTPTRHLFGQAERAFSHGCIRVNHPLELTELLLGSKPGWDRAAIDAAIASATTRRVDLESELPVLLLYWTVDPDLDGNLRFYNDLYGRDLAVLRALDKSRVFHGF